MNELCDGLSPRARGVDESHARALAEIFDLLPPIIVHRETKLIVDGAHRVRAAEILRKATIRAVLFTGSHDEARIEAVRANVTHGRPLTTEDRALALKRLVQAHPDWSDRRLAAICGVSPRRVVDARRSTGELTGGPRVGIDGRVRAAAGSARERAEAALDATPNASVREISRRAGVAEATVRAAKAAAACPPEAPGGNVQPTPLPATAAGLDVARWLRSRRLTGSDWAGWVDAVPLSLVYELADEARGNAKAWAGLAGALEDRARRDRVRGQ